jgi:hypothetical protein
MARERIVAHIRQDGLPNWFNLHYVFDRKCHVIRQLLLLFVKEVAHVHDFTRGNVHRLAPRLVGGLVSSTNAGHAFEAFEFYVAITAGSTGQRINERVQPRFTRLH